MIILSHPTGNQNVRQALHALEDAGLISDFTTSVAAFPGNLWDWLSRTGVASEFSRRRFDSRVRKRTTQYPWRELGRMIAPRIGLGRLASHESGPFCVDQVYQAQDLSISRRLRTGSMANVSAVYCYEDGALETFRAAKEQGVRCVYDLPIGYWRTARQIQSEEAERLPEWASTMRALADSDEKLARKDEELQLADSILVASSFTASTLEDAPFPLPAPVVIPYGCPSNDSPRGAGSRNGKLRVLFVGGLSQRKGLSYLFDAVDRLGESVQLTVIGRKPRAQCAPLEEALGRHRWIETLSHADILREMRSHDVFVFPSLFEGFGLVVTEALSQGLPVIATPHTCAPDILSEGVDGFVVPIRNSRSIAEKLEMLLRDRERLEAMSEAAKRKAAAVTWENYRCALIDAVRAETVMETVG